MLIISSHIKLRRTLATEDDTFIASQEVLIYRNELSVSFILNVSIPKEISMKK